MPRRDKPAPPAPNNGGAGEANGAASPPAPPRPQGGSNAGRAAPLDAPAGTRLGAGGEHPGDIRGRGAEVDLLVCAATLPELRAFGPDAAAAGLTDERYVAADESRRAYLLTGVGIPCAFSRLYPVVLRQPPRRILNIGIAGAYPDSGLVIGDVVVVQSEVFGDVGFQLPEEPGFRPIADSPFAGSFYQDPIPLTLDSQFMPPTTDTSLSNIVQGCTVSSCTGREEVGRLRERLFRVNIETMEGAAVAQVGHTASIPVCQVRAISNIAARRNMTPQNIALALSRLSDYLRACRNREDQ